jgi:hypothetical protein
VGDDVTVNSDVLLVTDFVNLKIKPAQSFRGAHRGRMYGVFIDVSGYTCMSIYVCTVFLKKNHPIIFTLLNLNICQQISSYPIR